MHVKFTLPIYYSIKKNTLLVGMNKYERMHPMQRNNFKHFFYDLVRARAKGKINGQFKVKYRLFYKNKLSDAPNVIAVVDKVALDGLQYAKVIENDNVQYYLGSCWEIGGQDKDNPRVEVEVYEA